MHHCDSRDEGIFNNTRIIIDSAEGFHGSGQTNANVKGINLQSISTLKFFPLNLEKIFSDMIMIYLGSTNLQEIKQDDIKVFPKLQFFHLHHSEITTIDKDLFEFNPDLKAIFLNENQISHIDPNVFDHLNYLIYLNLNGNNCEGGFRAASDSRSNVLELIQMVKNSECSANKTTQEQTTTLPKPENEDCSAKFNEIQTNLTSTIQEKSTLSKEIIELQEKLRETEIMNAELNKNLVDLNEQNEKLQEKCDQSTNDLEIIQSTVNELKASNEKLTKSLSEAQDKCEIKILQIKLTISENLNDCNNKYTNLLNAKLIESEKIIASQNEQIRNINKVNSADEGQLENGEADDGQKKSIVGGILTLHFGNNQPPIILVN